MKRILFIILFVTLGVSLYAQSDTSKETFLRRVDSFVARLHEGNKMDTAYVAIPTEKWAVRLASEASQSWIDGRGVVDGNPTKMYIHSKFRYKERITVGYRNIALGVAVDPNRLLGHKGGITAGLTSYGNKFGFKLEYYHEDTYHGNVVVGEEKTQFKDISAEHSAVDFDFYFVMNRKFSMNSVFGLSYIQKKSAGSVFFTATGNLEKTLIKKVEAVGTPRIMTDGGHFGIGAGYGYNYVFSNGVMLHGSFLPNMLVYNKANLAVDEESRAQEGHITDISATVNISSIYHKGPWFGGVTLTLKEMGIGKFDVARVDHIRYMVRLSAGKRF